MILNSPYITGSLTVTGNTILSGSVTLASGSSIAGTASLAVTASNAATASSADNFTVRNTLTAQTLVVQTITSSVEYITGSSINGSLLTNTHDFTGSVRITGSLTVNNTTATLGTGSANYVLKYLSSNIVGNSLIWDNGTNVGIGNTNTSYTLDVSGTSNFRNVVTINSNPYSTEALILNGGANQQYIAINSGTGYEAMFKAYNPTAGSWYMGIRASAGLGSTSSWHLYSSTYGADVAVFNTDGTSKFAGAATFSSSVTAGSYVQGTCLSSTNGDGVRVYATTATAGGSQPGIGYYTVGGSKRFTNQLDVSSDTWAVTGTTGTNYLLITQAGAATFSSSITATNAILSSSASNIFVINSTDANGGYQRFQRSGTDIGFIGSAYHIISGGANTDIALSTNSGAVVFGTGAALTERMRITSGGSVGIGTTPQTWYSAYNSALQISSGAAFWGYNGSFSIAHFSANYYSNSSGADTRIGADYASDIYMVNGTITTRTSGNSSAGSSISWTNGPYVANTGNSWTNGSSDIRLKKNFETTQGLAELLQIEPVKYHFNQDEDSAPKRLGFKAQNILPLIPEMVIPNGYKADDGSDYLTITPDYLLPVLVKAIQEQQAIITSLQNRLTKAGL